MHAHALCGRGSLQEGSGCAITTIVCSRFQLVHMQMWSHHGPANYTVAARRDGTKASVLTVGKGRLTSEVTGRRNTTHGMLRVRSKLESHGDIERFANGAPRNSSIEPRDMCQTASTSRVIARVSRSWKRQPVVSADLASQPNSNLKRLDQSRRDVRLVAAGTKRIPPLTIAESGEQGACPSHIVRRDPIADEFRVKALIVEDDEAVADAGDETIAREKVWVAASWGEMFGFAERCPEVAKH